MTPMAVMVRTATRPATATRMEGAPGMCPPSLFVEVDSGEKNDGISQIILALLILLSDFYIYCFCISYKF